MSLRPGIGYSLLGDSKACDWYRQKDDFKLYNDAGYSVKMPRYLRNRIYSYERLIKHREECMNNFLSEHEFHISKGDYQRYIQDGIRSDINNEALYYKRKKDEIIKKLSNG